MIYKLRDYQEECVKTCLSVLRDELGRKEVAILPTAAGKAIIIAHISKELTDGKVLVLQPNIDLLNQGIEKLEAIGAKYSTFSASAGKKETEENLIYATPKSLTYKDFKDLNIKYVIVDECDFASKPDSEMVKLLKKLKIKSCLGLTASAFYLEQTMDGAVTRMMHNVKGAFFTDICFVTQISELVSKNYWSDIQYFDVFDHSKQPILVTNSSGSDFTEESKKSFYEACNLKEKVAQFLSRLPEGEDALVFVPSIEEAEELQKLIPNSVAIHSKITKKQRKEFVDGFKEDKYRVAITPLALTVGFDKPSLKNLVDCTPTNSIRLHMQKTGRITRIHKDKKFGRIIDFAGNVRTHGDVRDLNYEYIEGYGWGLFKKDILINDVPMDSEKVFTKDFLRKGGKPKVEYVFGEHNPGDAVITFGANKGKKVKELYYRKRHYLKWLANSDFDFKDKELERQVKLIYKKLA
jgi:DNA repair protein RadD